ncbi:MAG: tRNA preQ1(34) S-adenosylmethionine ribosyltransferase-isomerase QueA [Pseudomonadota bacterium]
MRRSDFTFELPEEQIAQRPPTARSGGRLLVLDGASGAIGDRQIPDIVNALKADDLLVFNDTRVITARLAARKATGGKAEILIERLQSPTRVLARVRASRTPAPGSTLHLADGTVVTVAGRQGELFELDFPGNAADAVETLGDVPLPPYISRTGDADDAERYQTVYAREPGAVAAPTAGLHFDETLLNQIAGKGVQSAYLTLHVGSGTFAPVRVDDVREHRMHSEYARLSDSVVAAVERAKEKGGRVIAVGTTAVRTLESAAASGTLQSFEGETDLFIYPGRRFQVVDAMITNFHLPESTLLMLVCAFAGTDHVLAAYRHAVSAGYRFFSYGDAMFVTPSPDARHAV